MFLCVTARKNWGTDISPRTEAPENIIINISTRFRCNRVFIDHFTEHSLLNVSIKEFLNWPLFDKVMPNSCDFMRNPVQYSNVIIITSVLSAVGLFGVVSCILFSHFVVTTTMRQMSAL